MAKERASVHSRLRLGFCERAALQLQGRHSTFHPAQTLMVWMTYYATLRMPPRRLQLGRPSPLNHNGHPDAHGLDDLLHYASYAAQTLTVWTTSYATLRRSPEP